jgi:DNA-binding transcriptional LysR family regulator
MHEPIETAELLAFVRTVDAKSLSRAAAELRVPRATVGRRLARLEQRLGTRLLRRTTRTLSLTDAGDRFYRHARSVLDALGQAEDCVRTSDGVVGGEVRVSVPPNLDESFSEMITAFVKAHPDVRLTVDASSRVVDLQRDGYDVALRAASEFEPGLVARTIARHRAIAVASPAYLAEKGTPRAAKDLKKHRCLTGFARGELPQSTWPAGRGVVRVDGVFSANDLGLLRDAAISGLGIALLPMLLLREALENGTLVQVLRGVIEVENRLAVVYVEKELLPPQVRAFVEALVAWAPKLVREKLKRAAPARRPG